jgi:hypothetical protein
MRGQAVIVICALVAALVTACDDGEADRQGRLPDPHLPHPTVRQTGIAVYDDRIRPIELTLPVDVELQVLVENYGRTPCSFYLGDYVRGLQLAPGELSEVVFTMPGRSDSTHGDDDEVSMGCAGDPRRQARLRLDYTAG